MAELISIHPQNPQERLLQTVSDCIHQGGIVIYPTDTVYGMGCAINQHKAFERLCRIKKIKPEKSQFSIICRDLSHLSDYTRNVGNPVFKLMKKAFPGPYTFILDASSQVPRMFTQKKKTIGIRVPDCIPTLRLIEILACPLVNTSVHDPEDPITDYITEPGLLEEKYGHLVDIIVDAGPGGLIPSTVYNCSEGRIELIREGAGTLL